VFSVRYGLYLCVPYSSLSKQRLFSQTALTGWALKRRRNVFPEVRTVPVCSVWFSQ
jgi:hypothetical protein